MEQASLAAPPAASDGGALDTHPGGGRAAEQVRVVRHEGERTRIYVCVTCRTGPDEQPQAGARLYDALIRLTRDEPELHVLPVACLSVCKRPCTVSLAAPGKWTYVYGDLAPETGATLVRDAARLYAGTSDGLIPWRLRADAIKKGVVARVPPLDPPTPEAAS